MDHQADFCRASAWQATLPSFGLCLTDKWQAAANTSTSHKQQELKELTPEALYVLCGILLFVLPSLIGSSINAYESFRKAFPRKKELSLSLKHKKNDRNEETKATTRKKMEDESSTISDGRGKYKTFFDCFCIQKNARKILSTTSNHGRMDFINGIRAILFLWVFLLHFIGFYGGSIKNLNKHLPDLKGIPILAFGVRGFLAPESFIALSGFLTGYLFSDYYEKHDGKIPWISYYADRFLRITPIYMAVLGFYSTLFTYISSSPVWPTYNTNPVCKETWIWNLLYINNFKPQDNQCMGMTWFLACVMQLYVISPLFMIPLKRWPRGGYILSASAICISCFATFLRTIKYQSLSLLPETLPDSNIFEETHRRLFLLVDELNQKTYLRLCPYLIGLLLGFYLHSRNPSKKNNLLTLSFGWIMFALFIWICFFVGKEETLWDTAVANAVRVLLFPCAFSWLIFVCATQQGGFLSRLLSRPIFKPISRLSFCAFFTQIMVFEGYFLSVETIIDESTLHRGMMQMAVISLIARLLVWTFVTAFIVSVLFEYPVTRLLHVYFSEKKKTQ